MRFYASLVLCRNISRSIVFSSTQSIWGSKKLERKLKLRIDSFVKQKDMSNENEKILQPLRLSVKEQGDIVRELKNDKSTPTIDLSRAVAELKLRKSTLESKVMELMPKEELFERPKMEDLLKRRFFLDLSFSIYGGVNGLYDFGPMGCAIKNNLLEEWRRFFVLQEQMLEVESSILTPHSVLKASGHVDRFEDIMVKDMKTGDCHRADHLIEGFFEKRLKEKNLEVNETNDIEKILQTIDNLVGEDIDRIIKRWNIRSPLTNNELSEAIPFNLMFGTSIGPAGGLAGYLRPETAQGIFVNFKRLLEFNQGRLPFAAAQIGKAFRNEISPRAGLLRVREFTMAEIEYFVNENDKSHKKFHLVRNDELMFYSAKQQMNGESATPMKLGDAIDNGMVANESLGYFIGRINRFMLNVGVDKKKIRFRQHLSNEMAHYACDCWDCETLTSYGWVECVGCADRSAYDLKCHTKSTGVKLEAERKLTAPKEKNTIRLNVNKSQIGIKLRGNAKKLIQIIDRLNQEDLEEIEKKLKDKKSIQFKLPGDVTVDLDESLCNIERSKKMVHVEEFTPNVIEPSFGIGRIMYTIFEHNFKIRSGDEQRTYFSLPILISPYKCSVLPLSTNKEFEPFINEISAELTSKYISHKIDASSGAIGRRYARTDEIGIPYAITVDFDSINLSSHSVTLRERDSMKQIRLPMSDIGNVLVDLSNGRKNWNELQKDYPQFSQQVTETTK
ncbi:hypothetical protein SNEBB_009425 [Seison nebaliae]|nr:hypothetical protein SNEBB_009425 [Seison nebaliae]